MECELCFNQWNTETRIPKILPCGHSYCVQCLYNLIESYKKNPLLIFKCPNCDKELPSLKTKKDIMNLKKNVRLLSLLDKIETQKSRTNISNISMSQSIPVNTSYLESGTPNIFSKLSNTNDDSYQGFNNLFFPLCNLHKNKATFFNLVEGRINYICNECIQSMPIENLNPMPNLKINNEFKIDSSKNRVKILKEEVEKIENFLKKYQSNFEIENQKKIDELFTYINQIISYNYTTALTVFTQCKNEQKNQIDKKIKELIFLKNELDTFDKKLDELSDINDKKPEPESQIELDNVFNKLGNYINYENELNLFQMNISIKDEIKDPLFDLIQNAIQIDVDFLKMKNGELPTIKELLNKSTNWNCSCGEQNNLLGKIICNNCSKYRPLETYTNIIFNPMFVTKQEKKEYSMRRKHESKVYQSLLKRNNDPSNNKEICFYAIETSWLNKWKCFINNDCTEKIMSNNDKPISENKNLGVLPPGIINNIKLCDIYKPHGKYRLKSGLKNKKDYFIINQYLWEWFLLNYNGGPEIQVEDYRSSLFSIEEDVAKNENIIENSGTVITCNNKGDEILNFGCSEINVQDRKDENTNKINPINNYNFNTKFSEFRVNNIENDKKIFFENKEEKGKNKIINGFNENKENKENQNSNNIILKKKTQIKSLIRNINIEDNKY